ELPRSWISTVAACAPAATEKRRAAPNAQRPIQLVMRAPSDGERKNSPDARGARVRMHNRNDRLSRRFQYAEAAAFLLRQHYAFTGPTGCQAGPDRGNVRPRKSSDSIY